MVEIESFEFHLNGYVEMKGVTLGVARGESLCEPVVEADEVSVGFSIFSLIKFNPKVRRVTVDGFTVYVDHDSQSNSWNLELLKVARSAGSMTKLPVIRMRDGQVKLSEWQNGQMDEIAIIPVNEMTFAHISKKGVYGFAIDSGETGSSFHYRLGGRWEIGDHSRVIVENGQLSLGEFAIYGNEWDVADMSLDIEYDKNGIVLNRLVLNTPDNSSSAEFSGEVENLGSDAEYRLAIKASDVYVSGKAKQNSLVYDEGLIDKLGTGLRSFLTQFSPEGTGEFDLEVTGRVSEFPRSVWTGEINCEDTIINYEKLPYQIESLAGSLEFTGETIVLKGLHGKHGEVNVGIDGYCGGSDENFEYDITISSPNMLFDDDLYKALNSEQKDLWYMFAPSGLVKLEQRVWQLTDKGRSSELKMDLTGCNAMYQHFPYPLKNLTGKVVITPKTIVLDKVVSERIDKKSTGIIELNGRVGNLDTDWPRFNIDVDARNIPIDATLMSSLPARQRQFYENIELDALTDVKIKVFPDEVGRRLVQYIANVNVKDATVIYDKLPVPISHVNLRADLTPDKIVLHEMVGQSGESTIRVSGDIWPADGDSQEVGYCLDLEGKALEIADGWISLLPERTLKFAEQLRPKGLVDVAAHLNVGSHNKDCDKFKVEIDCLDGSVNYDKFPYPLEKIRGRIVLTENKIVFDKISAVPVGKKEGQVLLDGGFVLKGDSVDRGEFSFGASEIALDDVLADSLPSGIRKFYDGIAPSGKFDLNVDKLKLFTDGKGQKWVDFISELVFLECGFGTEDVVAGMDAAIMSQGRYKVGHGLWSGKGLFEGHSMRIKNRQIDSIKAPIEYDPQEGVFACKKFEGNCYGGELTGDLSLKYSEEDDPGYVLQLLFDGVDLKKMIDARANGDQEETEIQGLVSGSFGVSGKFADADSKVGRLVVNVSDMKFAKRSFFGKVLATMQMTNPTDYIFNEVQVDAYLRRNKLVFEKIRMIGGSNVFQGSGTLGLDIDEVDLELTAFGKNVTNDPSLIESLARGLGSAMMKIEVTGKVSDPEIVTTTLPLIKGPLDIFSD